VVTRRPEQTRSLAEAVLWTIVAAAAAVALAPGALSPEIRPAADGHATDSLNLAVNDAVCGKAGYQSTSYSLADDLRARRDADTKPLRVLLAEHAGSLSAYCGSVTRAYLNSENSLTLLMDAFIRIVPQLSLRGLGRALALVRVGGWAMVALAAAWCGASVLAVAAFAYIGVSVLHAIDMELSVYPFLMVAPAIVAGAYAAAARVRLHRRRGAAACVALGVGALTAFATNLRTSYLPIYAAFFVVWIAMTVGSAALDRRAALIAVLQLVACFGAGYMAVDVFVINRVLPPRTAVADFSSAHHPIAHPLVLGVATPVNAFAAKLRIEWDDAAGLEIARRVDPSVNYLGPGYERALFRYYLELWRTYPTEMLKLYWFKLTRTGRGLTTAVQRAAFLPGLRPDRARRIEAHWNGLMLVVPTSLLTIVCVWLGARRDAPLALLVGLLSAAAAAILVESTVIMPTFTPMYHSYLLFFAVFLPLVAAQLALDASAAAADGLRAR